MIVSFIKLFGKKTWSNFGGNLFNRNCDVSNITGCPIWLFHAKLGYYLFQQLLKLKICYFNFSVYVYSGIFSKIHFLMLHNFKSLDEIQIDKFGLASAYAQIGRFTSLF